MNEILNIQGTINKVKNDSQHLRDEISSIKEKDVSVCFYIGNLKRLSLQALDLFNAMQRQVSFLNNQKKINEIKDKTRYINKRREHHGISVE